MKHYTGEFGTILTLDCLTDISDATTQSIGYRKPNGVEGEWPASVDGTTVQYIIGDEDLDVDGEWAFQAIINGPSWDGRGKTALLHIYPAYE